ncbi:C-type lectin 37Db [Drosophila eugracilis]|uniref:C-type lectin 37Db n=1 Tax=Drosophila eugracilis TaxID=29029 RepID=UPI0007E6B4F4|nr:C-type lectin 37Db [Drosophila eugracilis]
MFKYFLYIIVGWDLIKTLSAQTELKRLNQLGENQQKWFEYDAQKETETQGIIEAAKKSLEDQVKAIHDKLETKLTAIYSFLEHSQFADVDYTRSKYTHPDLFQTIGIRRFYLEMGYRQNWHDALSACRRMGGNLATIKNEAEMLALLSKAKRRHEFWVDINNMGDGVYRTTFDGKPAPYLRWGKGYKPGSQDCVSLNEDTKRMHNSQCTRTHFFICQEEPGV